MTRVATMLTTAVTTVTLGSSAFVDPPKTLIWNASASAPIGLYAVQAADDLAVTDLVAVMPPPLIAEFLADRGYLPNGMPLLKRILALPGQTICRNGLDILAYGATYGRARERDNDRSQAPGLARLPPPRRRRTLSHERCPGQRGWPLFRPVLAPFGHRPRAPRLDRRGRRRPLRMVGQHPLAGLPTTSPPPTERTTTWHRSATFTRTKHGFTGRLRTLSLDIELTLVPAEHSDAENAQIIGFTLATMMDRRSARAGPAPERRPANMSRCRSTIPLSPNRSAPTCSNPATTALHSTCSGLARPSARTGADPCRRCAKQMSCVRAG